MPGRQRLAVHGVGENRARLHRVADRQAALEPNRVRQTVDHAAIGTAEDHLAGVGLDASPGQDIGEERSGPFRGANGPEPPLHPGSPRPEPRPAIARALKCDQGGLGRQLGQIVQAQVQRPLHHAAHVEPP